MDLDLHPRKKMCLAVCSLSRKKQDTNLSISMPLHYHELRKELFAFLLENGAFVIEHLWVNRTCNWSWIYLFPYLKIDYASFERSSFLISNKFVRIWLDHGFYASARYRHLNPYPSFHKDRVRFEASGACQFWLLPICACYFVGLPVLDLAHRIM